MFMPNTCLNGWQLYSFNTFPTQSHKWSAEFGFYVLNELVLIGMFSSNSVWDECHYVGGRRFDDILACYPWSPFFISGFDPENHMHSGPTEKVKALHRSPNMADGAFSKRFLWSIIWNVLWRHIYTWGWYFASTRCLRWLAVTYMSYCSHNSFNYPRDCLSEEHGTIHFEISTQSGAIHRQEKVQVARARY